MIKHRNLYVAISIGIILGIASVFVYRPAPQTSKKNPSPLTNVAASSNVPIQVQVSIDQNSPGIPINKHLWGVNYDQFSDIDTLGKFSKILIQNSKTKSQADDRPRMQIKSSAEFGGQINGLSDRKFPEKNISLLRFPGGCGSESYDYETGKITLRDRKTKEFYEVASLPLKDLILSTRDKFQLIYTINMDIYGTWNPCATLVEHQTFPFPLHKSTDPVSEDFRRKLKLRLISDAQSIVEKYGKDIVYFELGNEYWLPISNYNGEYLDLAIDFAKAMKSIDPSIKLIVQTGPFTVPMDPWNGAMRDVFVGRDAMNIQCQSSSTNTTVPCFDYAQTHWYSYNRLFDTHTHIPRALEYPGYSIDSVGRLGFSPLFDLPAKWSSYSSNGSPLPIAVTEWNIIYGTSSESLNSATNMDTAFFTLETLFEYVERGARIAVLHNTNLMQYNNSVKYPFFLTSMLQGGSLLSSKTSGAPIVTTCYPHCNNKNSFPLVTTYTGRSSEGELYVFIANHSDDKAAVLNFSGIDGYNAAEAVTIYTNDGYGNEKGSTILTKTEQLTSLRDVKVAPVSITRLMLKKGAPAPPQNPVSTSLPSRTCNIETINSGKLISKPRSDGSPPVFQIRKAQVEQNKLSESKDMRIAAEPVGSYDMSLHIRTTNPGDWWDRLNPDSIFATTSFAANTNVHEVRVQNLDIGTYEVACNVVLRSESKGCSGAVAPGTTDTNGSITYNHCLGTSLIRLEVIDGTLPPTSPSPSISPSLSPSPVTIPNELTITHHLFVKKPTEGDDTAPYRDYKKFTIGMIDDAGVQKQYCTKNLDTNEFEYASGQSTGAAVATCKQNSQVDNPRIGERTCAGPHHEFTLQTTLNGSEAVKHWLTHKFAWGMGMDENETNKKFTDVLASTTKIDLTTDKNLSSGQIHTSLCIDQ